MELRLVLLCVLSLPMLVTTRGFDCVVDSHINYLQDVSGSIAENNNQENLRKFYRTLFEVFKEFVESAKQESKKVDIGTVTFSTVAEIKRNFGSLSSLDDTVGKLDRQNALGSTNMLDALLMAERMFKDARAKNNASAIILFSDGCPMVSPYPDYCTRSDYTNQIFKVANRMTSYGIHIYTVFVHWAKDGGSVGKDIMKEIASSPKNFKHYEHFTNEKDYREYFRHTIMDFCRKVSLAPPVMPTDALRTLAQNPDDSSTDGAGSTPAWLWPLVIAGAIVLLLTGIAVAYAMLHKNTPTKGARIMPSTRDKKLGASLRSTAGRSRI